MSKTLYITDLDGTLLRGDQDISKFTVETINGLIRKGMLFSYATARSYASANEVVAGLELHVPVILNNGVSIADPATGKHYFACSMEPELMRPVTDFLERERVSALFYAVLGGTERVSRIRGMESPGVKNYLNNRPGDRRMRSVSTFKELLEGELFYLTIIENEEKAREIWEICSQTEYVNCTLMQDTYFPEEWWVEIYRHDVSKAAAIRRLKEILDVDKVVCFGDNVNDLPMFSECCEGYAVANAKDELKAAATGIIGANDEDGVARWLSENAITSMPLASVTLDPKRSAV